VNAAELACALDAQRRGTNWRCACPHCGYDLSFRDADDGRLLAFCFGGCDFDEVLLSVELDPLRGDNGVDDIVAAPRASEHERVDAARQIYAGLAPAAGTIGESYIRRRAITIPVPSVLRFGLCPHRRGGKFPALVAPVVDVGGRLIGTHATFLRPDGSAKADFADPRFRRETRGIIAGGAIRLAPHDPERELAVGEGVETTLSAMQIFGLPGWAAVCGSNLRRAMPLPSAVRRVLVAVDHDLAGRQSAAGAHQRWAAEDRAVRLVMPTVAGDDFNDVLEKTDGRPARR
jgi:hypothetical protein